MATDVPYARNRGRFLRPYSRFARLYDATLGVESFRYARRAFEEVVRRYDIRFRSAADLGCGTGLFARYLARWWGVPVIAVDRSREMLRTASENGPCGGVRFSRQDIRALELPRPVDLVTANFDTVNHLLSRCELGRAFARILANLTPGGHFVFDAITNCAPLGGRRCYVRKYRLVRWEVTQRIHWDPARRRISGFVIQRGPDARDRSVELHRERAYSPAELGTALQDAGFRVRAVLDALTLKTALSCPPRVLVVAVRPARRRQPPDVSNQGFARHQQEPLL